MALRAVIDLEAFAGNVRRLAEQALPARTMLAVKADAYGHGMLALAPVALGNGADSLAVLEIPAALALREAGITAPLFAWLHGPGSDFAAAARAEVDLGVSERWQLEAIAAAVRRSGAPAPRLHLKIDTGLHRGGSTEAAWPELVAAALDAQAAGAVLVHGVWSHLADTSPEEDALALARLQAAIEVATGLGARFALRHLAASSAGIRMPAARLDLVRFGIAAYGVSPFDDVDGRGLGLVAPMTLRSEVLAVDAAAGTATIAGGYGDGLAAAAVPEAAVLIGGARRRLLELGPDTAVIAAPDARPGDPVVLFGDGDDGAPTAEEWAGWAGTIGDEIVSRIAARVPREYLPER